jgi:hypothetical protein
VTTLSPIVLRPPDSAWRRGTIGAGLYLLDGGTLNAIESRHRN